METTSATHQYTVLVTQEDEIWLAHIPALGIVTQGDDVEHAFEMAQDAIKGWLEIAREDGEEIPVEHHPHVRQVAIS